MTQMAGFIQFDSAIRITGEEGAWEAFVRPPGVVVRGGTKDKVMSQASKALDGMMLAFQERADFPACLFEYFKAHNVDFTVETSELEAGETDEQLVVRRRQPVVV